MKMTSLVFRLIRGWYDPDEQTARELRTTAARNRAIRVRIRAEGVTERLAAVQTSYELADARLRRREKR